MADVNHVILIGRLTRDAELKYTSGGMTEHRYGNPWAKPHEPQDYVRLVEPFDHAGCQIYHALPDQWDVVKAGVCISQRAGRSGAMQCAEAVRDMVAPTYQDVQVRMLERYGYD